MSKMKTNIFIVVVRIGKSKVERENIKTKGKFMVDTSCLRAYCQVRREEERDKIISIKVFKCLSLKEIIEERYNIISIKGNVKE